MFLIVTAAATAEVDGNPPPMTRQRKKKSRAAVVPTLSLVTGAESETAPQVEISEPIALYPNLEHVDVLVGQNHEWWHPTVNALRHREMGKGFCCPRP